MRYRNAILQFLYRIADIPDYKERAKSLDPNIEGITNEKIIFLLSQTSHIAWSRWAANTIRNFFNSRKYTISLPPKELKDWNDSELIRLLSEDLKGEPALELVDRLYRVAKDMALLKSSNEINELKVLNSIFPNTKWKQASAEEDKAGIDYISETDKKIQVKVSDFNIENTDLFDKNEVSIVCTGKIDVNTLIKYPERIDRLFLFNQKFTTLLIINHKHAKITQKSFNATIDCKNEDIIQYQLVGENWKKVN